MPLTLPPPLPTREEGLTRLLDGVASRLRRVIVLRAAAWLWLLSLVFLGGLAFLDLRYHLPSLVRALGLVAYLVTIPLLIRRWMVRPLAGSGDRVQIALRVERAYPDFNDALVSAVEFMDTKPSARANSVAFRKMAIRRAARKSERYEFDRVVSSRGLKRSLAAGLVGLAAVVWVAAVRPAEAESSLERIVFPFGGTAPATQTKIEILAPTPLPHRMARGEPLDLRIVLRGAIPDRVTVSIRLEGSPSVDQVYSVLPGEDTPNVAELTARIEPTRIPRDFQFRVRANDADSGWQSVQVLPPPVLVPLDGRPSPQLSLDFPRYTDLPSVELPDGSGMIECVAGTRVTLRAATDRRVARAWIGYRPEQANMRIVPALSPLGAKLAVAAPGFDLLAREVWADVPIAISRDGTILEVTFIPRLPGPYAMRFEDETGLGTTRMFDVRVQPDPAPVVNLDRPSAGRDSLLVVPDADVTFAARITDRQFAIRSVRLEYRIGPDDARRAFTWFDAAPAGQAISAAAMLICGPIPLPPMAPLRLRYQQISVEERLSLTRIRHLDGLPLKAGDVVTVQVAADDFDDVTGFKEPGRSHEVELVIVTRVDLEAVEQQAQGDIREEVLKLHAQQREARTKVEEAIQQLRNAGKLRPEDQDKLGQVEQAQQQIRNRIDNPADGLRAQLDKLRQAAKDNHLPRSATTERLDDAANELGRLSTEVLDPLAAELANARKQTGPKEQTIEPLAKTERQQKEVEQTLLSLLERLEPWAGAAGVRGEARSILNDVQRQIEKRDANASKVPSEISPEKLTPEQKAALDRAAVSDDRVAERGRQMVEKMNRLAIEKDAAVKSKVEFADRKDAEANAKKAEAKKAPAGSDEQKTLNRTGDDAASEAKQAREAAEDLKREADALRNAATAGDAEQLKEQLRAAGQFTRQNQPSRAAAEQKAAAGNLEKMLNALEEQKAEDADRLGKKLKDADKQLDELIDKQELLQKKVQASEKLTDPEQRKAELDKLGREQAKLEAEARDLAQKLSRNQGENAGEEIRRAAREMTKARERIENGDPPGEKIDDALDRLDDAQRELDAQRQKNDEELLREQAAKFADDIKAIRDRGQRLNDESIRIHNVVKKAGKWDRPVRTSLNDLRQQQQTLGGEVRDLIAKKFENAAVFGRMLRQSADAMDLAAKRMDNCLEAAETGPFDQELEDIADTGIQGQQKLAVKRLDQLLEALKPPKPGDAPPPAPMSGVPPDMPPPMGTGMGEQLPPLAQLKALRALQVDIGERTEVFDKAHPDRNKLDDDEAAELESLEKMQLDVAELIKELTKMPEK